MTGSGQRIWTDAERGEVARLLIDGLSARLVGEKVGLTRNAVIGRCHRDAELRPLLASQHAGVNQYWHAPGRKRGRPPKPPKPPKPDRKTEVQPAATVAPPMPWRAAQPASQHMLMLPLKTLGFDECKWPVASSSKVIGGFLFCGRDTVAEHVYCAEHCAVAYRPREGR